MKWVWLILVVSIVGNGIGLYVLDRALHYREQISGLEGDFVNEGLRLVSSQEIAHPKDKPLAVCIGGSLFRYWHLPRHEQVHLVNKGGVEEKTETTLQRMPDTVMASSADAVVINAGFCGLHTAVYSGGDLRGARRSILETTDSIVSLARENGVVPFLTTIAPVRPRVVFPHTGLIEYDKTKKREENRAIEEMNHMVRQYAREHGVGLIDFHAALTDEHGQLRKEYALQDGEHLSFEGYRALDRVLRERLAGWKAWRLEG